MEEIGISVKHVTDIMGEISQASLAQNEGIADINQALTTMDNITGQNVALVEHAAATARSLEDQASVLKQAVSVFTLR
jgi:methyl-accepting chemotaxis protein